ncbi:hypothetical protein D3C74_455010 [compost metagenome]
MIEPTGRGTTRAGSTATTGTFTRSRRMTTSTSSNGTVMGACGLWIATSTASIDAWRSATAATRSATVSMRSAGEPASTATTSSATTA